VLQADDARTARTVLDMQARAVPDARTRSTPGGLTRHLDPWALGVGAVALVTYSLHGLNGKLTRDLGVYAYGAQQVLAGQPPYVGIENRAGPLAHLLPVPGILAARVFGKDELLGMRVWYLLLGVACVVLAYLVVRDIFSSRLTGLVAAATMLGLEGFLTLATTGPREKTPMVMFMWCAIWALTNRRWLLTGIFVGLTTLTLQTGFFPLLAGVIAGLLMSPGHRVRAAGMVALGGGLPVCALVVYFSLAGHLRALLDGFVLLNAEYSSGRSLLVRGGVIWPRMEEGFGLSLWLLLGGLLAVLVLAGVRLADSGRRRDTTTMVLVACGAATLAGLAWTLEDIDSWVDAFPVLPFAVIGIGGLAAEVEHRTSARPSRALAVTLAVLPTVLAVHFAVVGGDDTLETQRATTRAVLHQVPDPTIWSIEAPQALVLAGRANPTRYQMVSGGLQNHVQDVWPGGLDGFVRWNLARRPKLIAVGRYELRHGDWAARIGPDYTVVARAPGVVWFARRSLGSHVIAAIRSAEKDLRPVSPAP
jgi:hypothetical protein